MAALPMFHLPVWVENNVPHAEHVLCGSAAPSLTLNDLKSLSSDPDTTTAALEFDSVRLNLGPSQGTLALRRQIANLYDDAISADNIITTVGTTGANQTVLQSLLHTGDHVICSYPIYPPLLGFPEAFQCDISVWRLDPQNNWRLNPDDLRKLIRPGVTKVIIVNSPHNPTGSSLDVETQKQILDIAREHDIAVLADEIFRPLHHDGPAPPSLAEHDYSKTIATSSLSKVWGMSGVRIGWIVCRDRGLLDTFLNARQYTLQGTSNIDEIIATEVLSDRCRPIILKRHLEYAQKDLGLLDAFVTRNSDLVSWTRPTAGSTAFIQFRSSDGEPEDDQQFCRDLLDDQGVLLSPGSLCFGRHPQTDFKGFARVHFTGIPENLQKALGKIDIFLEKRRKRN